MAELLAVPYCHLVFTLPHELNALAALQPRWVYNTLLRCTAATLSEFAANPRWLRQRRLHTGAASGRRTCAGICTCTR